MCKRNLKSFIADTSRVNRKISFGWLSHSSMLADVFLNPFVFNNFVQQLENESPNIQSGNTIYTTLNPREINNT